MALQVSGKAYVRGYEIETSSPTFIDIAKPRTTENFQSAITPEVGNFTRVTKVYGSPDLSPFVTGEITDPYKQIQLRDTATGTRGTAAGTQIGVARGRGFEHRSGNDDSSDPKLSDASVVNSLFNLYLFDIRMFTTLTLSGTHNTGQVVAGAKVTGTTSGATGFVFSASGTTVNLITVSGSFNTGTSEKITSSSCTATDEIVDDNATAGTGTDLSVSSVVSHSFDKVKQVFMDDPDSGEDFSADTDLNR